MSNIRKMDLIVALYIFGVVTAELMGAKTFTLTSFSWAHLNASVAIFVLPLLFTMVDVVVEVYGRARARSMVYSGLIVVGLLILYAALTTGLPPSNRYAATEPAYDTIFHSSIRIAAASLAAFAVSELMDVAIFARLRDKMKGQALWLRNNVTNFVAQFLDSAVFLTLAFYALGDAFGSNVSFIWSLLLPYWLIRCGLSVVETPLVYLGAWWLRGSANPKLKPATA
ncbi:MAG TPA: queuosine precursor transporter [Candidatus Saccharimonadales bacterium]|nr:queuosine precursor transporter [Candidatus Saccharimonadales bacterium]